MRTTLKRGVGRAGAHDGNGRAVLPPAVHTPVAVYRAPEPPKRSGWQTARRFFEKECAPHTLRWEDNGIVDRDVWNKAGAAGILCPSMPEQYGGAGGTFAHDKVEQNFNPVGRVYYSASTLICTPASRSQEVGLALGAQAGESRIKDVVTRGGFKKFRRAAETAFNLVFEAKA